MPVFWPLPLKLKPCTVNTDSMFFFSLSTKCLVRASIDAWVRSEVAPTGACTMVISTPWSSSGRKPLGVRRNISPATTASAR